MNNKGMPRNNFLWWLIPLCILGTFVIAMLITWFAMSFGNFPNRLMPGDTYTVDGRTYKVPKLPHMVYGTNQDPSLQRPVPMLDTQVLSDLRHLISNTFDTIREAEVDFWVTGGTLISATLWKQLMCYDDDCDIAVDWGDREYMWSPEFAALLDQRGLETFYLRGATLTHATREGAAVRVRKKGTIVPTLDIFFVREVGDGRYAKVNSWHGNSITYNDPQEMWPSRDWIYPTHEVKVDDMVWQVPNQAEKCLDQQYGKDWKAFVKSPQPLTNSHRFAFWISNTFFAWRVGDISSETDVELLKNPRRAFVQASTTVKNEPSTH